MFNITKNEKTLVLHAIIFTSIFQNTSNQILIRVKIHLSDHSKMAEQVDSINIDYVPNTLISLWPLVWFSLQEPAQQSYRDNSR